MNLQENEKQKMEFYAKKRIDQLRPEIAVKRLVRFYQRIINQSKKTVFER